MNLYSRPDAGIRIGIGDKLIPGRNSSTVLPEGGGLVGLKEQSISKQRILRLDLYP